MLWRNMQRVIDNFTKALQKVKLLVCKVTLVVKITSINRLNLQFISWPISGGHQTENRDH